MSSNTKSANKPIDGASNTQSANKPIDGGEDKNILELEQKIVSNTGEPELILIIKFQEDSNISGIQIDCLDKKFCPANIKLYSNVCHLDFSNFEEIPATECLSLKGNIGKIMPLKVGTYRGVSHLAVGRIKYFC